MSFLVTVKAFLVFPVFLIVGVVLPFGTPTLLSKRRSFRRIGLHNGGLAVLVQKMEGLLPILGVSVVSCSKVVLEIDP